MIRCNYNYQDLYERQRYQNKKEFITISMERCLLEGGTISLLTFVPTKQYKDGRTLEKCIVW